MKLPINIASNWTWGTISYHSIFFPPAIPAPVLAPCAEGPATIKYPTGKLTHALTTTVRHQKVEVALSGHDVGYGIIHLSYPPTNYLTPVHILFSSRKIPFSVGSVKMNGVPIAVAPLKLMTQCAEPTIISPAFVYNVSNTVMANMTWSDFLKGLAMLAVEIAVDLLFEYAGDLVKMVKGGKEAAKQAGKEAGQSLSKKLSQEATEKVLKEMGTESLEAAAEAGNKQAVKLLYNSGQAGLEEALKTAGNKLLGIPLDRKEWAKFAVMTTATNLLEMGFEEDPTYKATFGSSLLNVGTLSYNSEKGTQFSSDFEKQMFSQPEKATTEIQQQDDPSPILHHDREVL